MLGLFSSADPTVALPSGRIVDLSQVTLDPASQQFFYGGFNVTDYLSPDQKHSFPAFDESAENLRLSAISEPQGISEGGETGFLPLFTSGVASDIVSAERKVVAGTKQVIGDPNHPGTLTSFQKVAIVVAIVALAPTALKIVQEVRRK